MIQLRCPICGQTIQGTRSAEWPAFPFCSARCRRIDLGRWLGEDYRIAAADGEDEPADEGPSSESP